MSRKYDGDAHISPNGAKFLVRIEAMNFRGEVYITRKQARELRDSLVHMLRPACVGPTDE